MRYSLLSRFRGTLVGAAIGASRISHKQHQQYGWGRAVVLITESLIQLGRFDLEGWHDIWRNGLSAEVREVSILAMTATLPVALFYHENEIELRQNLLALVSIWPDDVLREGALAVGYVIAQSLTEKLNPTTLIAQIIAFLGPQNQLGPQMVQTQALLEQGAGLERAVNQLSRVPSTPITMAFYCFLSTIEDPRLSILRAARTEYQPQLTTALTGALSGAYNSLAGIPMDLQLAPFKTASKPLEVWGVATEAEMLHLSDSLLAVWSGVYARMTHSVGTVPVPAIAAPCVIKR